MKRIVSFGLAVALTVLILPMLAFRTSAETTGGTLGDVNGDYNVDAKDLTHLAKHVAKISTITDAGLFKAADVNSDGEVDAKDLTHLAKYVAKIIASLDATGDFPDMLAQNVKIIKNADLSYETLENDAQLKSLLYALDFSGNGHQEKGCYYNYKDTSNGDYAAIQRLSWFGSIEVWGWDYYPVTKPEQVWGNWSNMNSTTDPLGRFHDHFQFGETDFSWVLRNIMNADASACENFWKANSDTDTMYRHNGSFYENMGGIGWGYRGIAIQEAYYVGDYVYMHANIQSYGGDEEGYAIFKIKEIDGKRYWSLYSYSEDGYIDL